jgi:Barstar (barnase inhibitor)
MHEQLFDPDGPALAVLAATPRTVAQHLMAWTPAHPVWDILRVRGTKSTDESRFFDEVAAALQFPYYFGENWIAVWDCITHLHWLKGSSFLLIFDSGATSAFGIRAQLYAIARAAHQRA